MSPRTTLSPVQSRLPVKDDDGVVWHPAALSDAALLELHRRLVKVQGLGDAFADVRLSEQMTDRLRELSCAGGRSVARM